VVLRAGWAPLFVFFVHGTVSGWVVDIYATYPSFDIPMHLLGGFSIAYFLSFCVATVPEHVIASMSRPLVEAIAITSLTATASVCWELAEFASDRILGTHLQLGLADTMWDIVFGIVGGVAFVLVRFFRGRLGATASWITLEREDKDASLSH
jgi:hypothetical protein